MKVATQALVVALGMVGTAPAAQAQLAVGGYVGWLFDTEVDRLSVGADARYTLKDNRWALNPRFTYYLWSEGASGWQLDGNVLYRFPVAASERVEPYAGLGVGLHHSAFESGTTNESESKVAANLISGFAVKTKGKLKPWVHVQYTAAMDFGNLFIASFGASYSLGK